MEILHVCSDRIIHRLMLLVFLFFLMDNITLFHSSVPEPIRHIKMRDKVGKIVF